MRLEDSEQKYNLFVKFHELYALERSQLMQDDIKPNVKCTMYTVKCDAIR